jgi:hypothetical protein|nr:MAG TPA: hypothetical protein [Caudoviricetes sp.]
MMSKYYSVVNRCTFDDRIFEGFFIFNKEKYEIVDDDIKSSIVYSLAKAMFKEVNRKFVIYYDEETKILLPLYFLKRMKKSFLEICADEHKLIFDKPDLLDFYKGITNFFIAIDKSKIDEYTWLSTDEHIFFARQEEDDREDGDYEVTYYRHNNYVDAKAFSIKKVDSLM